LWKQRDPHPGSIGQQYLIKQVLSNPAAISAIKRMIPIAADYFRLDGIDYFRLKFIKEGDRVVALEGHDMTGVVDKHPKSK
jgi:hypothetical protein